MNCVYFRVIEAALAAVFLLHASVAQANGDYYGYECVTEYTGGNGPNCGGPNLPHSCTNAQKFAARLAAVGLHADQQWEDPNVYDTDSIDSNVISSGADASYTDTSLSGIMFWSMHGTCDYPLTSTNCTTDAQCPTGKRCFNLGGANRCVGYSSRRIVTCSSGDTRGHQAFLDSEIRLGESPTSGSWAGVGTNGNMDIAIFDTSCPLSMHWLERAAPVFAGLHMLGGYAGYFNAWPSTSLGDTNDQANRGHHLAGRLISGQPIGEAHVDTTHLDLPGGLTGRACVVSLSCAKNAATATWHLITETFPTADGPDEKQSPTWCDWRQWCNF